MIYGQFCPRIKASRRALSPRFKSSPATGAARCRALLHLGHNLWLSHFIGSFHRYNTYADLVSLHPLFQFALCLTGAKYQNRFCITDARYYLIVVIREMPNIISFPRIICRNQLWLK